MADNKKKAAMIIASLGPSPAVPMPEHEAEQDGHDVAAQEIMDAIHAKDVSALKEALKSFVEMCESEEQEPEQMPEEAE